MNLKRVFKILFLPNFTKTNPYQTIQKVGLKSKGIDVILGDFQAGWLSLFKTSLRYKQCSIIHIHWIAPYIDSLLRPKPGFIKALELFLYRIDIFLTKMTGKRIIWTVHNKFVHQSSDIYWERRFRRMLVNNVDKVLIHTSGSREELKKAYGIDSDQAFFIVPHCNFIGFYKNDISRERATKELKIGSGCKVFLFFGLIRHYKQVLSLIEVFKKINFSEQACLLIAGMPLSSALKEEVISRVRNEEKIRAFLRFIPDDEVQLFMNAADVVVLPFQEILMSGSVVLAMSFGKALIVPQKGCIVDLLDEGGAFFIEGSNSLGKALKRAFNADLEAMGGQAPIFLD